MYVNSVTITCDHNPQCTAVEGPFSSVTVADQKVIEKGWKVRSKVWHYCPAHKDEHY